VTINLIQPDRFFYSIFSPIPMATEVAAEAAQVAKAAYETAIILSGKNIATALAMTIGPMGAGIGIGLIGGRSAEAIGRNPEASAKIQTAMILMAIYCIVFALIIKFT
jgi:F-type H+-transporting ATPase subunit c